MTDIGALDFPGGGRFNAVIGDLLAAPVEAIVNAANGRLAHGGGVAAAIARAAGPALEQEGQALVRARGPLAVTESVVTTAGRLPFKGVIHAVGPRLGEGDEEAKLVRTLHGAFAKAHERGWTSVGFPGVSSGIFAVPHATCARAYLDAARGFFAEHAHGPVRTLSLYLFDGPLAQAVRAELQSAT